MTRTGAGSPELSMRELSKEEKLKAKEKQLRKEQKRKAHGLMKLDKGSSLAKEELKEKKKIRSTVLKDLLDEQLQEH